MPTSDDLLQPYAEARSLAEAAAALDALVPGPDLPADLLADCCDDLSGEAVELGDFSTAVRLQRRAIELGCTHLEVARTMLPWYLLLDGQAEAGEAAFADLREESPDDVALLVTIANARFDAGHRETALAAFDEAVALAKALDLPEELALARIERHGARQEQGLAEDEDDHLAHRPGRRAVGDRAAWALAWFPPDQRGPAVERWPTLAEDLADPGYAQRLEVQLRELQVRSGQRPSIAPLQVDALIAWASEHDAEPDSAVALSGLAADIAAGGDAIAWPPGRNDPCWCRSGRKYKRCCGPVRR